MNTCELFLRIVFVVISSVLPVLLLVKNGKVVSQMSMVTRNGFTFSNTITKVIVFLLSPFLNRNPQNCFLAFLRKTLSKILA